MKHLSIHDNLPRTHVLYLDGVIINSKTTEFVDTHSPLPEHNGPIHYTKCWYKLLQLSHVTTYPKIENWNESIVVFFKCTTYPKNLKLKWDDYVNIFSMQLNNAFSYLVSFFGMELTFPPQIFLQILYPWVWCSMLSLIFRIVLMCVVPEALCVSVLTCTILVGKLNKIFVRITQTINILHGLYCMVFKKQFFWCDTNSKLAPGLHGFSNKIFWLSDTLTGWVNFL